MFICTCVFCHMKCTPDMWSRRQEQIQSFFKTLNSKQKRFSVGMFFRLMWMVWDGVFRWLNPLCSLSLTLSFSRMFRIRSWWVIPYRAQPWKTPKFPAEHSAICKATIHNTLKQWQMLGDIQDVPFLTCWAILDLLNISNVSLTQQWD